MQWPNKSVDILSEVLAHRKGLLPLLGILLILANYILKFLPLGWISTSNLFLHIGLVIAILCLMLAWVLCPVESHNGCELHDHDRTRSSTS
jgi:hypothetical protein